MIAKKQLLLFTDFQTISPYSQEDTSQEEWGTFKDSLKAPIHSWFTYPAGFSYKAVESSFKRHRITRGDIVYDPFMGSGTTNVTAKKLAINSYGIEAHPFVFKIAKAKLNWNIQTKPIQETLLSIENEVLTQKKHKVKFANDILNKEFPELLLKCYEEETLLELMLIRDGLRQQQIDHDTYDFLFVGLTSLLRQVSTAATGWPYIAPNKKKTTSINKIPVVEFKKHIYKMLDDIRVTIAKADPYYNQSVHHIFNSDSRNTLELIEDNTIDHVFTSPPYLNNFDYADRTRLELYFFGEAKTWGDISQDIRSKLMTSATTQITRTDPKYILSSELKLTCPKIYSYLEEAIQKLRQLRLEKGGKKSYDLLVAGYFNDIYLSLKDIFRVLKKGQKAIFVLGDSAPYGVHIPTDEFIGKIGIDIGFSAYDITTLRERGGKWGQNPQRHKVKLKESIIILTKGL